MSDTIVLTSKPAAMAAQSEASHGDGLVMVGETTGIDGDCGCGN